MGEGRQGSSGVKTAIILPPSVFPQVVFLILSVFDHTFVFLARQVLNAHLSSQIQFAAAREPARHVVQSSNILPIYIYIGLRVTLKLPTVIGKARREGKGGQNTPRLHE